jgi:hypothetical protein
MEFFDAMDPLLKTFWFLAIPVSIVFIIQTIMTFTGMDSHDGSTADFDSNLTGTEAPFQLFSLRNMINFLLGVSWTGISFYSTISSPILLIVLSLLVGIVFVLLFFLVIRQLRKLAEDNSFHMNETLNKTAEVYTPIPENMNGKGKILISVRGSVHELDAMTHGERIPSSQVVKVVSIENNDILIVELL